MENFSTNDSESLLNEIFNEKKDAEKAKLQKFRAAGAKKLFSNKRNINLFYTYFTLLLGTFIFIFGIAQIKSFISRPIDLFKDQFKTNIGLLNQLNANSSLPDEGLNELVKRDSDQDKISDYDELYVYDTSPYLEDTDSDGKNDYDEIKQGTDPKCLLGSQCGALVLQEQFEDTVLEGEDASTDIQSENSIFGSTVPNEFSQNIYGPLLENNEKLMQAYEEFLKSQSSGFSEEKTSELSLNDLAGLPSSELRKTLLELGISQDLLNKVGDDELIKMVEETLSKVQP